MPPPVATVELACSNFLHHVARVLVEDGKEGFVGKGRDARVQRWYVVDTVGCREGEFGHDAAGARVGEGSAEAVQEKMLANNVRV